MQNNNTAKHEVSLKVLEKRIESEKELYNMDKRHNKLMITIGVIFLCFILLINFNNVNTLTVFSISLITYVTYNAILERVVSLPSKKRKIELLELEKRFLEEVILEKESTPTE